MKAKWIIGAGIVLVASCIAVIIYFLKSREASIGSIAGLEQGWSYEAEDRMADALKPSIRQSLMEIATRKKFQPEHERFARELLGNEYFTIRLKGLSMLRSAVRFDPASTERATAALRVWKPRYREEEQLKQQVMREWMALPKN